MKFLELVTAACIALVTRVVTGENVEVRPGKEIEFHEELEKGANWGVQFQIVEGTIGFRLASPEGVIFEGPAETYGSYALTAKSAGTHSFKFINNDQSGNPGKKISFSILGETVEANKRLDPVQNELRELNSGLRVVRDEHAFLMDREVKHREVAMNTNKRVMWWFVLQIAMLSGVCYWQIRSLKSFFETRRLV